MEDASARGRYLDNHFLQKPKQGVGLGNLGHLNPSSLHIDGDAFRVPADGFKHRQRVRIGLTIRRH